MHMLDASAWCTECDWKTEGKNAMGNAAQHNKKTGHFVLCELHYSQHFGMPKPEVS